MGNLVQEVIDGETTLIQTKGGLIRAVEVINRVVLYESPDGQRYQLYEESQEFLDGTARHRRHLGEISVSEKRKRGESNREAAWCALYEGLGVDEGIAIESGPIIRRVDRGSESYPGLECEFTVFEFYVTLDDLVYKPGGYVERQERKITSFMWRKIGS